MQFARKSVDLNSCSVCGGKDHVAVCPEGKTRKDNAECFVCKQKGHYGYECPDKDKEEEGNETLNGGAQVKRKFQEDGEDPDAKK